VTSPSGNTAALALCGTVAYTSSASAAITGSAIDSYLNYNPTLFKMSINLSDESFLTNSPYVYIIRAYLVSNPSVYKDG